jgi:signal transduction histidine kinase
MVLPILISILYLPYILIYAHGDLISNIFEVIMFYTIGAITGILSEKLHHTTEKNSRLEEEIQKADRLSAIGQLASGVAHEIRNPLAIIKTIAQTLKEESNGDNETKEALEIIEEEVIRADKVINELLDFSRSNKTQKKETLDIQMVLENVVLLTHKFAQQKGVNIEFVKQEHSIWIAGDEEKLKQAFINIIFNGIDAIEEKGKVTITSVDKNGEFSIVFSDSGVGVEEEALDKLFNPFYTTKEKGVGLGLSITYRIIEDHGGTIHFTSIINEGSKVSVTLPKVKVGN